MDTLDSKRQVIEKILLDYARIPYANARNVKSVPVFDRERDHYLLVNVGWEKRRYHGCLVHVDIIDGKFWIQRDGTEDGIAWELENVGVPKDQIVLALIKGEAPPGQVYVIGLKMPSEEMTRVKDRLPKDAEMRDNRPDYLEFRDPHEIVWQISLPESEFRTSGVIANRWLKL